MVLPNKKENAGLVHPHDIIGAAQWIWSKNNNGATHPSTEIWCRGVRGTEALVWRGYVGIAIVLQLLSYC